jgi:hypothetical protein
MKVSAWLGIIAITTGMCSLVACSDDGDGGTPDGGGATGGTGATGGSAGATGGAAGATGGTAGSTGGGAGADTDGGVSCIDCVSDKCAAEFGTCTANTDCVKLYSCVAACTDTACAAQCYTDNPDGQADFDAVEDCADTNCKTECGL